MHSWMKWYHRSMCFILAWNLLSFDNVIMPWLSQLIVTAFVCSFQISAMNVCNHKASFTAWVSDTYSASVMDSVMMCCFFELQETVLLPMKNAYCYRLRYWRLMMEFLCPMFYCNIKDLIFFVLFYSVCPMQYARYMHVRVDAALVLVHMECD